jgi:bifunctional oligoribonuclease and PAP phosphatase NrnA
MSDTAQQILDILSRSKRVLVTTHVRPDGDALGTAAAAVLALRRKNIDSQVLLLSHLPRKYAFIFHDYSIPHIDVESGWPKPFPSDRFDTLLVVDTGTWSQLPGLQERIAAWFAPKLIVDHHLTQENWATVKLVDTSAAAAGEILAELLQQWKLPLDREIATALFLAIASDTGWFQFANTRPQTLRLAADLMETGVDTIRLYEMLYQNERPERVALQTRAMQTMELLAGNRLAVMKIRKRDFEETHANVPDTENLINVPLQIRTVQVSMLITEPLDFGPVRISLRSKGQLDVAKFAEQFGGGGHARASGLKIEGDFQHAHDRVVAALISALGNISTDSGSN